MTPPDTSPGQTVLRSGPEPSSLREAPWNPESERFRPLALMVAILAWSGVVLQLYLLVRLALANGRTLVDSLVEFFGYFTILTNILVALVLTVPLVRRSSPAARFVTRPGPMTAVAASIALVSVGYHLLLRQVWDPQGAQLLADVTLHYLTPIAFVLYWAVAVPKRDLRPRHLPRWAAWPVVYLVYMLIRGAWIGLYPYPFLDLPALGAARVAVNALGLLVGFYVIAFVLLGFGRLRVRFGRAGGGV